MNNDALQKQVGGDHYTKTDIQPWEVIERGQLNYFEGNVIKYIMRHRHKNGKEDLQKIIHYVERLIEFEYPEKQPRERRVNNEDL